VRAKVTRGDIERRMAEKPPVGYPVRSLRLRRIEFSVHTPQNRFSTASTHSRHQSSVYKCFKSFQIESTLT
jgi:hypothetical protein